MPRFEAEIHSFPFAFQRVNLLPREPVVGAKEAASMRHINASSNGKQDREELETENGETTLNSG